MIDLLNISGSDERIRVGITHGDINGIGYEVTIKALSDSRMLELFTPVIYGHIRALQYHKKSLHIGEFNLNPIKDASQAAPKRINIINCTENDLKIDLGESSAIAGEAAYQALEMAVSDLKNKFIDVLVTAPINKSNIQSAQFNFNGHTEYLATRFETKESLMLMVWNQLRVGVVTGHVPLKEVSQIITVQQIVKKIEILNASLKTDFRVNKPKIAVLGLNPHAGDNGLIGDEELNTIHPAIEKAKKDFGILAFGPFAADGFFGTGQWKKYDAVLAMYHDQGLAPFKTIAFDEGVNYTAGLPIIRTSPAHGTAYEIAGKNTASEQAFRNAIFLAIDVVRNRKMQYNLELNRLKHGSLPNS